MRATLLLSLLLMSISVDAAVPEANYDEARVGTFELPDPFHTLDGKTVSTTEDWNRKRRPEILELFRKEMYGRSPGRPDGLKFEVKSTKTNALDGLATRKEILVRVPSKPQWPGMMVLVYVPNKSPKPAPAFTGLSFGGNHAITTESDVQITARW